MIIGFCPMLTVSVVSAIFYGSPMTQWTLKGQSVFFTDNYLKKLLLLPKITHAIYFSHNFKMCLLPTVDHL